MSKKESLVKKHTVHKYIYVIDGTRPIYRCIIPGCRHFIGEALILGQVSVCNRCDEEFVISKKMISPRRVKKPHCDNCSRPAYNKRVGQAQKGHGQLNLVPERPVSGEPEITLDFVDSLLKDFGVK